MRAGFAAVAAALVAAACGAEAQPSRAAPVVLRVRLSRFVPAEVRVPLGATVRIVVHNDDPIDHELIVGDEAVQDRHESGREAHHGDVPGEVSVEAGSSAETTYTFDTPGLTPYGCHLPGHWAYGMRGAFFVSPA